MTIIFYRTESEKNRVTKILEIPYTMTGTLKENTDIINPNIKITSINGFNIFNYNYCYIQELNRYYFIDRIDINSNTFFTLSLSIDVLMTYKNNILNLECHIKEYSGNNAKNELKVSSDYNTTTIEYDNPFTNIDNSCMVLIALNGSD